MSRAHTRVASSWEPPDLDAVDQIVGLRRGRVISVEAVGPALLHLRSVTARGEHELGTMLRWGYGSAFGLMHEALRRRLPEPWASLVFGGMLMTATLSLFPLLGRTRPPWRWSPDVVATSFGTHALYVAGVVVTSAVVASDRGGD